MPTQSATVAVLSCAAATVDELPVDAADCSRLLELLGLVPDPRKRRGVRQFNCGGTGWVTVSAGHRRMGG